MAGPVALSVAYKKRVLWGKYAVRVIRSPNKKQCQAGAVD